LKNLSQMTRTAVKNEEKSETDFLFEMMNNAEALKTMYSDLYSRLIVAIERPDLVDKDFISGARIDRKVFLTYIEDKFEN
tara:strand:- start:583 stop:822 length:240 start_codon:yes stop_codon:yes gene_type:complete